jgi:hypothetical protein
MKRILYFLLAAAMLAMFGCTGDSNTTSTANSVTNPNANTFTPKGTVSGVLRDAVTLNPLGGAVVHIMDRTATTDATGIFTITNVPATAISNNESVGQTTAYNVVIDMAGVNAKITAGALYPAIEYSSVVVSYTSLGETTGASGLGTNHDTPMDGFVANIMPQVGKLDANIKMQVVGTDLKPVSGATVSIFVATTSGNNTSGGAGSSTVPGHLINTQTSDANGLVTFANLEAKQSFLVKAVTSDGAKEGWYGIFGIDATTGELVTPAKQGAGTVIIAPTDNLTDIYAVQGGAALNNNTNNPLGRIYNNALVVSSVDNIAPFVLSASPANLADIAIPATGTLDVVFTFSEPIASTTYANALTNVTSIINGLYKDVAVNYNGPKASNLGHTLAWNADRTTLTVSILATDLVAASRYSVSISAALAQPVGDANQLTDAVGNIFVSPGPNATVTFTTAGGLNIAAPVIQKSTASTTAVEWVPVTNAASYNVYAEKVGFTAPALILNTATTSFNLFSIPGFSLANGATYKITVTAVNGAGTESAPSNVLSFSDTAPGAPTALARRSAAANVTETNVDWTPPTPAPASYKVYLQQVINGVSFPYALAGQTTLPTFDVGGLIAASGGYTNGQLKVTYNVKVTAVSLFGSESAASNIVVIDDKTAPVPFVAAGRPVAPIAVSQNIPGTLIVQFDKEMLFGDITNPASWNFAPAGAVTATVTYNFGGTLGAISYAPFTLPATPPTATVPYSIVTNATGTVAAGVINVTCTAKSVGGGLAATASF